MGCGASKMEGDDQLAPGLRPIRRKIEEVKRRRRRRSRRYSIVSTTELLHPDETDADVDSGSSSRTANMKTAAVAPEPEEAAAPKQEKKKEETVGSKEEEIENENENEKEKEKEEEEEEEVTKEETEVTREETEETKAEAALEIPGSPSFRFYYLEAVQESDDDSVKLSGFQVKEKLNEIKEKAHETEDSTESTGSTQESGFKQLKKEKGKKILALSKAPSAVRQFFNVKSCYNNNSNSAAPHHENPSSVS